MAHFDVQSSVYFLKKSKQMNHNETFHAPNRLDTLIAAGAATANRGSFCQHKTFVSQLCSKNFL